LMKLKFTLLISCFLMLNACQTESEKSENNEVSVNQEELKRKDSIINDLNDSEYYYLSIHEIDELFSNYDTKEFYYSLRLLQC